MCIVVSRPRARECTWRHTGVGTTKGKNPSLNQVDLDAYDCGTATIIGQSSKVADEAAVLMGLAHLGNVC